MREAGLAVAPGTKFPLDAYNSLVDDFVDCAFRRFKEKAHKVSQVDRVGWQQFSAGIRGIPFRYAGMIQAKRELEANLVSGSEGRMTIGKELRQDIALVHWISDGYSALECSWYATAAMGGFLRIKEFPDFERNDDEERLVNASRLSTMAEKSQVTELQQLAKSISALTKTPDFRNFKAMRNTLQHRSNPAKLALLGNDGKISTSGFDGGHFLWVSGGHIRQPHSITSDFVNGVQAWFDETLTSMLLQINHCFHPLLAKEVIA